VSGWPFKELAAALTEAKSRCRLPVLVGSGVTPENVAEFYGAADGLIVGSYFKRDGLWSNPLERGRVERLVEAVRALRAPRGGLR